MSEQSEQSKQRKIAIVTGEGRGINSTVNPKPLLHLEGAAVLIVSLVAYRWNHGGWIDYAANARVGAATYNAVHTYLGPLPLAGYRASQRTA